MRGVRRGVLPSVGRSVLILSCAALIGPFVAAQPVTTVHAFSWESGGPQSGLIEGTDGRLYGTTYAGGIFGAGSVYVLAPNGGGGFDYSVLHAFPGWVGSEGAAPFAPLLQASDGFFYGTTAYAGSCGGTLFRIDSVGNFTVVHDFACSDGIRPKSGLHQAADGYLYGTTSEGGAGDRGTIYRVDLAGNFEVLHQYAASEGAPSSGLTDGGDGYM